MCIKFKQMISAAVMACMLTGMVVFLPFTAFAATAKIAFSDPSAMVGSEVNVTMKISSSDDVSLDNVDIMLTYDPAMLEFVSGTGANGGAGSIKVTGSAVESNTKLLSYTLKFKALSAGTTQIQVSTQEIYDGDSQLFTVSKQGNSTVKITPVATASGDATLSSLKISPGVLSPQFSGDVTFYTATVGEDAERVAVNAGTSSANARVVISGNEQLAMGENVITCKVTAEDGQTVKEYQIHVTKVEGQVPGDGSESAAGDGSQTVTGEEGIATIETAAAVYIVMPLDEGVKIPEGLTESKIEIAGKTVQGWVWSSAGDKQYCVFYAANPAGEKGFYRYDLTEKTMQRYFEDPNADTGVSSEDYVKVAELYNNLTKDYKLAVWIIRVLVILIAVSVGVVIYRLVRKSSGKEPVNDLPYNSVSGTGIEMPDLRGESESYDDENIFEEFDEEDGLEEYDEDDGEIPEEEYDEDHNSAEDRKEPEQPAAEEDGFEFLDLD